MTTAWSTELCPDEAATRALGARLARELAPGSLVALEGELGAGKTAFARGLAEGLGIDPERVGSPSFVLAMEHRCGRLPLLHCDLYRLANGAAIDDLGIEEALADGWIVAVEWGERLPILLRRNAWRVVLAADQGRGADARFVVVLPPTVDATSGNRPSA